MIKEFKKFIARGNVMDLAVGVIIGGAFSSIVSSLVDDILMPIIGIIIGGINFSGLHITFKSAVINYGMFIQNIIDFIIVAFCIFLMVKGLNKLAEIGKKKEKEEVKNAEPVVSEEVKLLREINENLKAYNKKTNK